MRILLVGDDKILAMSLTDASTQPEAYVMGQDNLDEVTSQTSQNFQYDGILIDLELSELPGYDSHYYESGNYPAKIPVLIIPIQNTGFESNTDNWRKALKLPEFKAVLKSLICQRSACKQTDLILGSLRFNTFENRAYIDGKPLVLSARETHVLELLIRHPNKILSKQRFLDHLQITNTAIEVYICRLRKKLAPYGIQVRVIRRVGYLIETPFINKS